MKGQNLKGKFLTENPDPEADIILMQLIGAKDEKALGVFYDIHSSMIYSLVLKMTGSVFDAEEIVQEVFLKIWNNADKYDGRRGSVQSWIITIARRLAIDRTRSKQFKMRSRESSDESSLESVRQNSQDNQTSVAAEIREVNEALEKLDSSYRDVINLSYYEGYSHSEIANHLDIPLGTVKYRIREAVDKIRRLLDVTP
jgi:RNA polymerase sigma-70 factor (ECF subfamily)